MNGIQLIPHILLFPKQVILVLKDPKVGVLLLQLRKPYGYFLNLKPAANTYFLQMCCFSVYVNELLLNQTKPVVKLREVIFL